MNWTQIVPVVVAAVTVIGGLLTYLFQKQKERSEDLIKIRRSEYRKWVKSLYDALSESDPSSINKFNQNTNDLFLFASDNVMNAVGNFKYYMAATSGTGMERNMRKAGNFLAKVILEMRNDCFEVTKLTESEIRNILPIQGMRDDDWWAARNESEARAHEP